MNKILENNLDAFFEIHMGIMLSENIGAHETYRANLKNPIAQFWEVRENSVTIAITSHWVSNTVDLNDAKNTHS